MWMSEKPKNDNEYFERMSRALFQAGLNWKMIDNKWPSFKKAFDNFSVEKVARFGEKNVKSLMKDTSIVRNEKKIRATIFNAQEYIRLKDKYGSFSRYLDSFEEDEETLMADLETRFKHLGKSTGRIFLYMTGMKLQPTQEEMKWHAGHIKKMK